MPAAAPYASDFALKKLEVRDFRNIERLSFEPAPRFNVIAGANGQGKTSLLEALYLACTSRSFRTLRLNEMRRQGSKFARVDATLTEQGQARHHRVTLSAAGRTVFLDEQKPPTLSSYALLSPVVIFHPGDLMLTTGGASLRRNLLDRVGLFLRPSLLDDRRRFSLALKERQRLLERRGTGAPELAAYEVLMAQHGAALCSHRQLAATQLAAETQASFEVVGDSQLQLALRYRPGGCDRAEEFARQLHDRRSSDERRPTAGFGPHRDEFELTLDGRSARHHASQGQHRILSLALKLAELALIRNARGAHPLLLLDDVSSELDPERISAVYRLLQDARSQVFVTTTRPELFETPGARPGERSDLQLKQGHLEAIV